MAVQPDPFADAVMVVDDETADRMARLEAMGIELRQDLATGLFGLMDRDGELLIQCPSSPDPVAQTVFIRSMLAFYEDQVLAPTVTRH